MKITFSPSFERDFKKRNPQEKEQVYQVLSRLSEVVGKPHLHGGIGLRKLHPSGIFEARLGLGLRMVFGFKDNELFLHRLGNHDAIRKYIRNL